jgi:hypothetical protein
VVGIQGYKSAFAIAAPLLLLSASELGVCQSDKSHTSPSTSPSKVFARNSSVQPPASQAVQAPDVTIIIDRMIQAHAEEVAQRRAYNLTRNYRIYEGTTQAPKSEITAVVTFLPPQSKSFAIVQSTGGMAERMVRKALEREVELARDPTVSQIVPANYDFEYAGEESVQGKRCFVLLMHPKRNTKDLLNGRLWVDAERYSIRQVEGEPAATPSWWVKNVHLLLTYADVDGMWIQTGTEATAHIRMAGDYKMVSKDVRFDTAETVSDLVKPARISTTSGSSSPVILTRDARRHVAVSSIRNAR